MEKHRKEYVQKRDIYLKDLEKLQESGNQHIRRNQEDIIPTESTSETSTADIGLENNIRLFKSKYHLLFLRKKEYPTTSDILYFGSTPEKLESVLKTLNERDEIWIENGKLVLKGYEIVRDYSPKSDDEHNKISAKVQEKPVFDETNYTKSSSEKPPRLQTKRKIERTKHNIKPISKKTLSPKYKNIIPEDGNKVSDFLKTPYIKDYLALLLSDGKKAGESSFNEAVEVIKILNSSPLITDEIIKSRLDNGTHLNAIRHHLTRLRERGILSYEMKIDNDSGWKTYEWYFSGCANLKESYIFDMEKRLKELESEMEKDGNGKYACGKSGGIHPVLDFASVDIDSEEDGAGKCAECGEPLIFLPGDELMKPINLEISKLREAVEEVSQIEV